VPLPSFSGLSARIAAPLHFGGDSSRLRQTGDKRGCDASGCPNSEERPQATSLIKRVDAVQRLWDHAAGSKLGSFCQNLRCRATPSSLTQGRRAALRIPVKGGQPAQKRRNLLNVPLPQSLLDFLMEPQPFGLDLGQPIGERFDVQACFRQHSFEERCKAMAARVHSGAGLSLRTTRPGARSRIFAVGQDLLFGGHQLAALFADSRARESTLSATLRNSLARLELRRSISLRKTSNCRCAAFC